MLIKPDYLSLAIQKIRPGSEYKFIEQKIIHNVQTNEILSVPLTEEEIIKREEQALKSQQVQAETEGKRLTALAKLEALGLDEDDLKALGL